MTRWAASLAPHRFDLIDRLLGLGLGLLLAGLRERELGIRLRAHEDELGALVVAVLHELLGLLHFLLRQLHGKGRARHGSRSDFLRAADGRLGGRNAFGGRRIATASSRKYRAHD